MGMPSQAQIKSLRRLTHDGRAKQIKRIGEGAPRVNLYPHFRKEPTETASPNDDRYSYSRLQNL